MKTIENSSLERRMNDISGIHNAGPVVPVSPRIQQQNDRTHAALMEYLYGKKKKTSTDK